jgi:P27 family predicted phage terminase small subunit
MKKSDGPPSHLTAEAKRLWAQLIAEYSIDDAAGRVLLQTALESYDRLAEARELLAREGIVVADRFGQAKAHPATAVERDARAQLLAALRALRLEPGELGSEGGL